MAYLKPGFLSAWWVVYFTLTKPLTTLALTVDTCLGYQQAQRPTVSAPVANTLRVLGHEVTQQALMHHVALYQQRGQPFQGEFLTASKSLAVET